jgi:anthranilate phosphoribosyltransferase
MLNAAYAILAAGKAGDIQHALLMAGDSIDSNNAMKKLEQLKGFKAK